MGPELWFDLVLDLCPNHTLGFGLPDLNGDQFIALPFRIN